MRGQSDSLGIAHRPHSQGGHGAAHSKSCPGATVTLWLGRPSTAKRLATANVTGSLRGGNNIHPGWRVADALINRPATVHELDSSTETGKRPKILGNAPSLTMRAPEKARRAYSPRKGLFFLQTIPGVGVVVCGCSTSGLGGGGIDAYPSESCGLKRRSGLC